MASYIKKKFKGTMVEAYCYGREDGGFRVVIYCRNTAPKKIKKECEMFVEENYPGANLIDIIDCKPMCETRMMTVDAFYEFSTPLIQTDFGDEDENEYAENDVEAVNDFVENNASEDGTAG